MSDFLPHVNAVLAGDTHEITSPRSAGPSWPGFYSALRECFGKGGGHGHTEGQPRQTSRPFIVATAGQGL